MFGFILSAMLGSDPRLIDVLPEPESLVPAIFMGWLPSGFIAAAAMITERLLGGAPQAPKAKSSGL